MGRRALVIGLAVTGVLASSCSSTARDAFMEAYNEETAAINLSDDDTCRTEDRTSAVAIEAFYAQNGRFPATEAEIVPDYLLETYDGWEFQPGESPGFVPTPDGDCADYGGATDDSPSIGQIAVDGINDTNGATCAVDRRAVETAVETHFAVKGYDAVSIDELAEFGVNAELNHWTLETPVTSATTAPTVVAIPDGPCDN